MPREAEARLARLEGRHRWRDRPDAHRRRYARFTLAICAEIRAQALAAGIDPATIRALRFGEEAAAELAALGDSPEQEQEDRAAAAAADAEWRVRHPGEPDAREVLIARLNRLARCYAGGSTPDPNHSLAGWYAWARSRASLPAPT